MREQTNKPQTEVTTIGFSHPKLEAIPAEGDEKLLNENKKRNEAKQKDHNVEA